eukprot:gene16601-22841_t
MNVPWNRKGAAHEAVISKGGKVIHAMRHGTTEMNVFLRNNPYGSGTFRDPGFFDTVLTPDGREGAKMASRKVKALAVKPEVLVVSPLTRALQTADFAFGHMDVPVVVEALARERVWLSSDCGSSPEELARNWPAERYSFSHLPAIWWSNGGNKDPKHVVLEPEEDLTARVQLFREWLLARPEKVIGLVAHWGLLDELTGDSFSNCELRSYGLHPGGKLEKFR